MEKANLEPILKMEKINKIFPGVHALKDVDFELYGGQVCGLFGENGAGKSTLMNVLGGVIQPDSGSIYIDNALSVISNAKKAETLGISFIHQELSLFPELDIATNIYIQDLPKKAGLLNRKKINKDAEAILRMVHLEHCKPGSKLKVLKIGEMQLVEIGRALAQETRILILDEPTSSLTKPEIDILFKIVRSLKEKGVAIIFISHHLDEVFEICDTITILRDGQKITSCRIKDITRSEIVSNMIGHDAKEYYDHEIHHQGEELLAVKGICSRNKLGGISFEVHRGEVVGIYGLLGSGRSEILRSIFGLYEISAGEFFFQGKKIEVKQPQDAISAGIALVTEDRRKEGLVITHSVKHNLTLATLKEIKGKLFINSKLEDTISSENIRTLRIATPSSKRVVRFLSGGNQQKVVLSKWLNSKPQLLMLDEPTRGIDVGAKREIYTIIDDLLKQGIGVLLVSSELSEIMSLCDRVIVIKEGRIAADLYPSDITQENLLSAAMGA